jgi:beta-phosphoglucomutase
LVPSESKGIPSESAQFLQEIEAFSKSIGTESQTPARVVVLAESYKVRDFDRFRDTQTHIPLKGKLLQRLLYIAGMKRQMPSLHSVSLFSIDPNNIFVHINELGIFPNVGGKFDLRYCTNVFESETNLLGFFTKPLFLRYKIFDEIKAILFDFNGVITDDEEIHYMAFSKTLQKFNIDFPLDKYEELCHGRSDEDGYANIQQFYAIELDIQELVKQKHNTYLASVSSSHVKTFPGIYRLLREFKNRGYKIALVTASNREEVDAVLKHLQLNEYFHLVITDEDVDESKPSPEGYLVAARELGISPSRCIVVEDSLLSIRSVSTVGMKTIGIRNQKHKHFEGADYIFESVEDILVV